MQLPVDWHDDASIRRAFTYVTKARLAPRFGSLPIAYYQADCVKAIDAVYTAACVALEVSPTSALTIRVTRRCVREPRQTQWFARIVGTQTWRPFRVWL